MKKKKIAFDYEKYLKIQKESILKRIAKFDKKLYLEFGGKLFDDYHASRVLPGFPKDAKIQMLSSLKDKCEVIIVVNSHDINSNKVRSDFGITYEAEVERLLKGFANAGLKVNSIVVSFFEESPAIKEFEQKLSKRNIKMYKSYKIAGYPQNLPVILSDEGLGKNEYIETTKPLVVVTAPGPGSGKMATCLSQLYHDSKRGIKSGYAKYETFPVWNLPLKHPINLAYEAATVDLDDVNMIDPFHLEHYGIQTVNYNRDVETFPLLKAIFTKIYGESPYYSPTDMGVNMIGNAIINEEAAIEASKAEIIRRYYCALKQNFLGKFSDDAVSKAQFLMNYLNITKDDRKCVKYALEKEKKSGEPSMSLELLNGKVVTGRRSELFSAPAALMLNALKTLGKIDDSLPLISPGVFEPIKELKTKGLHNHNPRIHVEEALIALAIQANTNPLAAIALKQLPKLEGCQAHSTYILHDADFNTLGKLGINVTEEPVSYVRNIVISTK